MLRICMNPKMSGCTSCKRINSSVIEGIQSIFNESWKLCEENDEIEKYLMTFQNLLSRVPKWNDAIVEKEVRRIIDSSGCTYLNDLVTVFTLFNLRLSQASELVKRKRKLILTFRK